MSFHVFLQEEVNTAIYKIRISDAWDLINIIKVPAIIGITTLGLNHIAQLGNMIEKIT